MSFVGVLHYLQGIRMEVPGAKTLLVWCSPEPTSGLTSLHTLRGCSRNTQYKGTPVGRNRRARMMVSACFSVPEDRTKCARPEQAPCCDKLLHAEGSVDTHQTWSFERSPRDIRWAQPWDHPQVQAHPSPALVVLREAAYHSCVGGIRGGTRGGTQPGKGIKKKEKKKEKKPGYLPTPSCGQ
ncbi:hypothetical protein L209DRAFT_128229 [Thermothelomyces heterothallicus CBS 203.75]